MCQDLDRPTLFVDIDGVLNIFPRKHHHRNLRKGWVLGYKITVDSDVIRMLNDIIERGQINVVWLTTWRNLANLSFSKFAGIRSNLLVAENALGIEDDDLAEGSEPSPRRKNWHKSVVLSEYVGRFLSPSTRWVFVDDDVDPSLHSPSGDKRGRIVAPSESVGLTTESLSEMEAFLLG